MRQRQMRPFTAEPGKGQRGRGAGQQLQTRCQAVPNRAGGTLRAIAARERPRDLGQAKSPGMLPVSAGGPSSLANITTPENPTSRPATDSIFGRPEAPSSQDMAGVSRDTVQLSTAAWPLGTRSSPQASIGLRAGKHEHAGQRRRTEGAWARQARAAPKRETREHATGEQAAQPDQRPRAGSSRHQYEGRERWNPR